MLPRPAAFIAQVSPTERSPDCHLQDHPKDGRWRNAGDFLPKSTSTPKDSALCLTVDVTELGNLGSPLTTTIFVSYLSTPIFVSYHL